MENKDLCLGWSQAYVGLKCHMEEALIEKNLSSNEAVWDPKIALFSKKYYNQINELNNNKIHDYCFIGSINSAREKRQWVIDFAKKYFTCKSVFINSDNDPNWDKLGPYDYTNIIKGYCPKNEPDNQTKKVQYRVIEENKAYFETMCQSKFVLCPEGDAPWSFRFYEVLMCKSIPIVESRHHTYRTKEEANINYKYVLYENINNKIKYQDYISENIRIFEKYHMIS